MKLFIPHYYKYISSPMTRGSEYILFFSDTRIIPTAFEIICTRILLYFCYIHNTMN